MILGVQFAVAVLFATLLVFPAMGRDYEAAVAGLYGSAERAFLVVPLVSGCFIDISNSLVIQGFLQRMG